VSQEAAQHLEQANYMVFEANYDEQMLDEGLYPPHLKIRIKANTGHLSNVQCGQFLSQNYKDQMHFVFLCHLSRENNMPEIAYETVKSMLKTNDITVGEDIQLVTLNRYIPSDLYIF
jgi:phosphoribosyl 1,2-cyclic phosphodiesterase